MLLDVVETVYAEFAVDNTGASLVGLGRLDFQAGRLQSESTLPLTGTERMYGNLVEQAGRLAASYRTIGYRGVLCVDAVVTSDTDVVLTEVNARTTTSTHLHTVLAANLRKIVQGDSVTISQHHAPAHWPPLSTDQFLGELKRLDLAYDPNTGGGVVMTTPSKTEEGSHSLMFAVLGTPGNQPEYLERLGRLAAVPRDLAAPPAIRASS